MDLSRRNFLKFGGATAAGVAVGGRGSTCRRSKPRPPRSSSRRRRSRGACARTARWAAVSSSIPRATRSSTSRVIPTRPTPWAGFAPRARRPSSSRTIPSARPRRSTARPARTAGRRSRSSGCTSRSPSATTTRARSTSSRRRRTRTADLVTVNRLEAIASLGSACIDNEECYLLSKLNRALGHRLPRASGPSLTLRHGPSFGDHVRTRGDDDQPDRHPELGCHHGHLEHGREPPGGLPVGDEGQGARAPSSSTSTRASRAPAPPPTSTCRFAPAPTSRSSAA